MSSEIPSSRGRSVWAVVAGLLFIVISSSLVDAVLHVTGVFPPWGQPVPDALLGVATAYRIVLSMAGCYLTARMAPSNPMKHALILGVVGVVVSTAGLLATWNAGPAFGGKWYPVALILVSLPCAWLGGRIFDARYRTRAAVA